MRAHQFITEGGNVFKNTEGAELTRRISRKEIPGTISWLESITGLDLSQERDESDVPVKWLGTTGRKADSGDLDLSVDAREATKEGLVKILTSWCLKQGIPADQIRNRPKTKAAPAFKTGWIDLTGDSVHFRTPINGDPANGFAQTDFMFSEDPTWQQYAMRGGVEGSQYKGMHRQIMMASIARAQGYKYSYKNGLSNETTGETTKNPDEIAGILLGPGAAARDTYTVDTILKRIRNRPDYEQLVAGARETLGREGVELPT